jgi:hypothetical protein
MDNFQPEGALNDSDVMGSRNIEAICYAMLALPFGLAGGLIALLFAAQRRNE